MISDAYRATLKQKHAESPNWGRMNALAYTGEIGNEIDRLGNVRRVLDFGCGKGKARKHVIARHPGIEYVNYDPGVPAFEALPVGPFDLAVCIDMLEHAEPDQVEAILAALRGYATRSVYLTISLVPARATLPDGRNAHLTVQPAAWWLAALKRHRLRPVWLTESKTQLRGVFA